MIPLINIRGYTAPDPLDKASGSARYLLAIAISAILSILLIYAISDVWRIIDYRSIWVKVGQVAVFALIFTPVVVALRKSSSLVLLAMTLFPILFVDLYLETHVNAIGGTAPWTYYPGSFLGKINPPVLKFLIGLSADAFIVGPLCLWITRLLASLLFKNRPYPEAQPTPEQRQALFPKEWTQEIVAKPQRDIGYWILRLLGLGYLTYLMFLVAGALGSAAWPAQLAGLLDMAYKNPALMMNTYGKIGMMVLLTFIGAYNVSLRWHCTLVIAIAHIISTAGSLAFYFSNPGSQYRDFLLTSAIVDGVMVLLFIFILIKYRSQTGDYGKVKEFPAFFSVPAWLSRILYYAIAVAGAAMVIVALYFRVFGNSGSGLGAVYGYPDPMLTNTLTLYSTIALIAFLLASREKLREHLTGIMLFPIVVGAITCVAWFSINADVLIDTQSGGNAAVDQYFMIYVVANFVVVALVVAFRKMYYGVEYIITSLSPSEARNVMAIYDAFYGGTSEDRALALRQIDLFAGNIRGRKRGLVNFPFWLIEHLFNFVYGLHPVYSSMSREECRYFMRKYMIRQPQERSASFSPDFAELAFALSVSAQALCTFAHYASLKNLNAIGYIPPDARERLKSDYPSAQPPSSDAAQLPGGPGDPFNFKPNTPAPPKPLFAKRPVTAVSEPDIPPEVDYLIMGSGAGGAVMAYRLATSGTVDPTKIAVIERGARYSPLQDMNDNELEMIARFYKEGGLQQTKNFDMIVLQGECVGGTTVVNNAVCFEMSPKTRAKWENTYDIDLSSLDAAYQKIRQELDIVPIDDFAINRNVRERFLAGVAGYNQDTPGNQLTLENPLQVNAHNPVGDGLWNLGNKRQRKRSMLESYIPWAEASGANVISNTSAVRFISEDGKRAASVLLRSNTGDLKQVKVNRAVIVAGGCIASSHFLMRSGLRGNVGNNLCCNFAFPVAFGYSDKIDAFDGVQITVGALDPEERAIFETYFNPPAAFALSVPFFFDRNRQVMKRYDHFLNFGALVGSDTGGTVQVKADPINGRAFTWELTERDIERIRYTLDTLLKIGQKAGASEAILPTRPGIAFELTQDNIERFISAIHDYPLRIKDLLISTAHPQGGNRMTGDNSAARDTRTVDGNFRVDGFSNVYVADASLFPDSTGVNPQLTIMAMSSLAAGKVLEAHG